MRALDLLQSLGFSGVSYWGWYILLFLLPPYYLGPILVPIAMLWRVSKPRIRPDLTFSVILAANNEEHRLRRFVQSVTEQTIYKERGRIELIVVDDGSTDRTAEIALELQREGKIDKVLKLDQRSGKSAAINLAITESTGEILIMTDADTTFDRDAFAEILVYFADPQIGAVCGVIGPLNDDTNLLTRFQTIEYAYFAYLRRSVASALGMLPLVVGAFNACRRTAIEQVGRHEPHLVEDCDIALKLKRAGWRVVLAPEARALMIVPETFRAFLDQRLRWDEGVISLWTRKAVGALDPRDANFSFLNASQLVELIAYEILLSAIIFEIILAFLWHSGEWGMLYLFAIFLFETLLVFFTFMAAAVEGLVPFRRVVYVPYFMVYMYVVRLIRLVAVIAELVFFRSLKNPIIPSRVASQVEVF